MIYNFYEPGSPHYTTRMGRAFDDNGEVFGVCYYDSSIPLLKRHKIRNGVSQFDQYGHPILITERKTITILWLEES